MAASNAFIDDGHLKPHGSRVLASSRAETPRNLRSGAKATETEGSLAGSEERLFSNLGKLRNVFKKDPNVAKTLATDPRISEKVAKSSGSISQKTIGRVRAFLTRNPSMTRGLDRYETEQLVAFLSIVVSIPFIGITLVEIAKYKSV
ncbi:hypothetical protein PHYSODRAFT_285279 [Phytophthora sojae]|uniref:Uncharacterized protein n=2 Tax=Phytophthora sojae TaxID=67593 RepID=G4Z4C9_PHYSP|nr:hypothetical protein PHYSODRAFT_285279 [Phytophthora sojae]EGZ19435.1 hypothetical protein PHYSODRAFT_285279 [Phytophthora sojae]|eukprot:XP_009522152.1 hypothetical protein PHYSODRAFT_285279 [Phytophthora sojae]